jgi:hypothetical protein
MKGSYNLHQDISGDEDEQISREVLSPESAHEIYEKREDRWGGDV